MNLLPRWMRRDAQRKAASHEPDPGDMGTAFGLEATLASEAGDITAPPTVPNDDARWQQRLNRRPVR